MEVRSSTEERLSLNEAGGLLTNDNDTPSSRVLWSRESWGETPTPNTEAEDPDLAEESVPEVKRPLTKFHAVRIIPEDDAGLKRNSSFPFLPNENLLSCRKSQDNTPLLRGPRRVLRLCLFAVLLPLALITVPLYVKLVVYSPKHYSMAPSDQRLVDNSVSSIWCQGQSVSMNGTFNAYLVPDTLTTSRARSRVSIQKALRLYDDVKEYWGFYLKKGSTVTLNACIKQAGGQLMILRGVENLHKCAWIGEEDSLEEGTESPSGSDDVNNLQVMTGEDSDEDEDAVTNRRIGSRIFTADQEKLMIGSDNMGDLLDESAEPLTSVERQDKLHKLLWKAVRLTKGKSELLNMLDIHHVNLKKNNGNANSNATSSASAPGSEASTSSTNDAIKNNNQTGSSIANSDVGNGIKQPSTNESDGVKSRTARAVQDEDRDGAFEETDEDPSDTGKSRKFTREEIKVEQIVGGVAIPDGLTYERGFVNQSRGGDMSNEEARSSFSSSEEALQSCNGVILAMPLHPDSQCKDLSRQKSNTISYDVSVDGTYFFVFSSDNEITVNNLYFNLTLDKVVYDTSENLANCTSSTNCSLSLGFWSHDKTVVEIPPDQQWENSYVLNTNCEPRVAIYLFFLLLVPLIILFCAFQ